MLSKQINLMIKYKQKSFFSLSLLQFLLEPYLYIFIILNIPSLKLIYSSSIINIAALLGLYFAGFWKHYSYNQLILMNSSKKLFMFLWFVFWLVLFYAGFWSTGSVLSLKLVIRYLIVYFLVIGGLLFTQLEDIKKIINLQIVWGSLLSILLLTVGISLNRELGQNYLTIGVPIAGSLLASFGYFLWNKKPNKLFFLIAIIVLNVASLSSLPGRSPILFPVIIIVIYTLYFLYLSIKYKTFSLSKLTNKLILIFSIILVSFYIAINTLSDFWLSRFNRMLYSPEEESRIDLYEPSIDAIFKNPFGYGLNEAEAIIGFYPHNIFLEVFISGGIIAILFLLLIILVYGFSLNQGTQKNLDLFLMSMVTNYFFMVWNISFDLGSSYLPFTGIAIFIAATQDLFKSKQETLKSNKLK